MKKILFYLSLASVLLGLSLVCIPVFAQSSSVAVVGVSTASSTARKTARLEATATRLQTRANTEIDRRVTALNKLQTKIQEMKKVTDTEKSSLTSAVQAQINLLNNLKTKISADTDSATLKTDVQSITKAYRIYALILPQTSILAAADRLSSTTDLLSAFETKLQARIATDQTAGKDVTSTQASIADMTAKIADAKTQAQAAIAGVSGLVPDNGDKTIAASNLAALKTARNAIKTGTQDLKTAYKDGLAVRLDLKKIEKVTATSTSSVASTTVSQ